MKKVSIIVPTYNEVENVQSIASAIQIQFDNQLSVYDYEIIFIDNYSTDGTRNIIEKLCIDNSNIKAIFNAKNFGWLKSPFYGLCQATGDCAILMSADFQDPPDLIPLFIKKWEEGYKIVCGVKNSSKENAIIYFFRSLYYKLINKFSDEDQIEHFTGFGLYDRKFVDVLNSLDDPMPYLRGIVSELGFQRTEITYTQPIRKAGKSKSNFLALYDVAMLGITSYTKMGIRIATLLGFCMAGVSLLIALIYLILKLVYWDQFPLGTAPILIGVFLIGSIQLCFIGLLGEYIMSINTRVLHRPMVIEEKRINFDV